MLARSLRKLFSALFMVIGALLVSGLVDMTPMIGSPQIDYPSFNIELPFWPQLALNWVAIGGGAILLVALGMLAFSDEPVSPLSLARTAVVEALRPMLVDGRLTPETAEAASRNGSVAYQAVETLLKGAEVELPPGHTFTDKDGHVRNAIRTRWWDPSLTTYRSAYIGPPGIEMPDVPIPAAETFPEPDRPTFIGHYWLDPNEALAPLTSLVACVDYSVAKGGPLVAYRFDGEAEVVAEKFVAV